ncbi:hypothetical protein L7F22_047470 [Adiantum nelumboides]|nr:hypothetical protein [Adiantum nelumboides]
MNRIPVNGRRPQVVDDPPLPAMARLAERNWLRTRFTLFVLVLALTNARLSALAETIPGCRGFVEASHDLTKARKSLDSKPECPHITVELQTLDGLVKDTVQCAPQGCASQEAPLAKIQHNTVESPKSECKKDPGSCSKPQRATRSKVCAVYSSTAKSKEFTEGDMSENNSALRMQKIGKISTRRQAWNQGGNKQTQVTEIQQNKVSKKDRVVGIVLRRGKAKMQSPRTVTKSSNSQKECDERPVHSKVKEASENKTSGIHIQSCVVDTQNMQVRKKKRSVTFSDVIEGRQSLTSPPAEVSLEISTGGNHSEVEKVTVGIHQEIQSLVSVHKDKVRSASSSDCIQDTGATTSMLEPSVPSHQRRSASSLDATELEIAHMNADVEASGSSFYVDPAIFAIEAHNDSPISTMVTGTEGQGNTLKAQWVVASKVVARNIVREGDEDTSSDNKEKNWSHPPNSIEGFWSWYLYVGNHVNARVDARLQMRFCDAQLRADFAHVGDERDAVKYSWNSSELQMFEINDSVPGYKAADSSNHHDINANGLSGKGMLPRLPPVWIHLVDKNMDSFEEGGYTHENDNSTSVDSAAVKSMASTSEGALGWGVLADGLLDQDFSTLGLKSVVSRPFFSQGIVEDLSEQLSSFATALDGQSERWYPNEYCVSDTWEDKDDPGYHKQPIEGEEWGHFKEFGQMDVTGRSNLNLGQLVHLGVWALKFASVQSYKHFIAKFQDSSFTNTYCLRLLKRTRSRYLARILEVGPRLKKLMIQSGRMLKMAQRHTFSLRKIAKKHSVKRHQEESKAWVWGF